jgi:hypothetical protein
MNEHLQELLEERGRLYEQIHALQTANQMWIAANQRFSRQLTATEQERDYWQRLAQQNT